MEAEIKKLVGVYVEAMENQDWDTLKDLCSDDFVISGERGRIDLQSWQEHIHNRLSDHKITPSNIKTGMSSDGEMAWAKFDIHEKFLWDESPTEFNGICTATFEKKDSKWILTLIQFTTIGPQASDGA